MNVFVIVNVLLVLLFARAKYIIGTVNALQSKPGGGEEWLRSLRKLDLEDVVAALCTLPGVGPKVAACIALFSLDQHHAIPVDTHVWRVSSFTFHHQGLLVETCHHQDLLAVVFLLSLDIVIACNNKHVNLTHYCNRVGCADVQS